MINRARQFVPLFLMLLVRVVWAQGPSFSCTHPTPVEQKICASKELSALDRQMTELYSRARMGVFGTGAPGVEDAQKHWLHARNTTKGSLNDEYHERIEELAQSALFNAPTDALAALPASDEGNIVRAIYTFVVTDSVADRQQVLAGTVSVFLARSMPADRGVDEFRQITDAKAALDSDHAFAIFLDIATIAGPRFNIPCAAIYRKPELIDALGAKYGGAADGSLPRSDCMDTLPVPSAFKKLDHLAESAQPLCEGTIRFSEGADYGKTETAVLLHRVDLLRTSGDSLPKPEDPGPERQFMSAHRQLVMQAQSELAAYYARYFSVPAFVAHQDAAFNITFLIDSAFAAC